MELWLSRLIHMRTLLWGPPLLALLLGAGLYFSVRTGFFQIRCVRIWLRGTLLRCLTGTARHANGTGEVSPFAAMCTALAATVGTGNLAGVAAALSIGGPGAIFWMWVAALSGQMLAFAENVLGILYRRKGSDGTWRGGPMYYLRDGLGSRMLAALFAAFCVLSSFGVGNMTQGNSIAHGLRGTFGVPEGVTGLVMAALLAAALAGGLRRISRTAERLVPVMALFYMAGAAAVLVLRRDALLPALQLIVQSAFSGKACAGGVCGFGLMQAIRVGIARGAFSNEAGLGSSVLAHAASGVRQPCEQGMWAIFEVFFDTIVMCTATALVILTSGAYDAAQYALAANTPLAAALPTGAALTAQAFSAVLGPWGGRFVAVSLALFAFSTMLGWSVYGMRAVEYLFGARAGSCYKTLFVLAAAAGSVLQLDLVWALGDICNALMALPNLIGVLALRLQVLQAFRQARAGNQF